MVTLNMREDADGISVVNGDDLFSDCKQIRILFSQSLYQMNVTKAGGLILTKKTN